MRKGQASVEYLVTYGWAFLVVLVAVGALVYFGVANPSNWVPDSCDFGGQLECEDYEVAAEAGQVRLLFRNGFGKEIEVTDIRLVTDGGEIGQLAPREAEPPDPACKSGDCLVAAGGTNEIRLGSEQVADYLLTRRGEKLQLTIRVQFKRNAPGAQSHWLTGILYTRIA